VVTVGSFDPGVTVGVALISATPSSLRVVGNFQQHAEVLNPFALLSFWKEAFPDLEVVAEDFLGTGPRSHASNVTLKVLGGIKYACRWHKVPYTEVASQVRLHALERAKTLCTGGVHAADALAHAIAYAERKWS